MDDAFNNFPDISDEQTLERLESLFESSSTFPNVSQQSAVQTILGCEKLGTVSKYGRSTLILFLKTVTVNAPIVAIIYSSYLGDIQFFWEIFQQKVT